MQDPNVANLKKKFNAVSKSYKKAIAQAKFKHIDRIGQRLIAMPSVTRAFWFLAKALEGNFCHFSLPLLRKPDDTLAHSAKEKAKILGTLFAIISTLDDGGKTPPKIPR